MNQRDGVFTAVKTVVGEVNGKVELTKSQKDAVHAAVIIAFLSGAIEYKGGTPDEGALKKYVPGLVNNWMRKDTRLNGGAKYTTKNPGIRAGSGDAQLKAMRQLLAQTTDTDAKAEIESAIEVRVAELKPAAKALNVEALPENLRKFVAA